jgi:hypothetical protein
MDFKRGKRMTAITMTDSAEYFTPSQGRNAIPKPASRKADADVVLWYIICLKIKTRINAAGISG